MFQFSKLLFSIAAVCGASTALAAPVSLGAASAYNLVSLGSFSAQNSSIGGAVAVAGSMTASGYNIAGTGAKGDTLVVGGNLNYSNASVQGQVSVGGKLTASGTNFTGSQVSTGATPVDFASLTQQMQALSDALALLTSTGRTADEWGGLKFTGSNSAVEVFSIAGDLLSGYNWSSLANLQAGSTVIVNVSGKTASVHGGIPSAFASHNVLYNFFEAETVTVTGTNLYGSLLAPDATLLGGGGQVYGNVVAGNWASSITLNAGYGFQSTEVAGYARASAPALAALPAAGNQVPEPGALALTTLALALLLASAARSKRKAVRTQA